MSSYIHQIFVLQTRVARFIFYVNTPATFSVFCIATQLALWDKLAPINSVWFKMWLYLSNIPMFPLLALICEDYSAPHSPERSHVYRDIEEKGFSMDSPGTQGAETQGSPSSHSAISNKAVPGSIFASKAFPSIMFIYVPLCFWLTFSVARASYGHGALPPGPEDQLHFEVSILSNGIMIGIAMLTELSFRAAARRKDRPAPMRGEVTLKDFIFIFVGVAVLTILFPNYTPFDVEDVPICILTALHMWRGTRAWMSRRPEANSTDPLTRWPWEACVLLTCLLAWLAPRLWNESRLHYRFGASLTPLVIWGLMCQVQSRRLWNRLGIQGKQDSNYQVLPQASEKSTPVSDSSD